ncbi:translation initiation factor IF-2-like [Camelus ferus]|uniref:Translation initiation factor IF-2-like n=1 Tax=Camelus ferus TaxID=419612 RepID=A0A8B8RXV5_CAMFR|nr:translation initiation factor IF-2-like [Camelus ferus]
MSRGLTEEAWKLLGSSPDSPAELVALGALLSTLGLSLFTWKCAHLAPVYCSVTGENAAEKPAGGHAGQASPPGVLTPRAWSFWVPKVGAKRPEQVSRPLESKAGRILLTGGNGVKQGSRCGKEQFLKKFTLCRVTARVCVPAVRPSCLTGPFLPRGGQDRTGGVAPTARQRAAPPKVQGSVPRTRRLHPPARPTPTPAHRFGEDATQAQGSEAAPQTPAAPRPPSRSRPWGPPQSSLACKWQKPPGHLPPRKQGEAQPARLERAGSDEGGQGGRLSQATGMWAWGLAGPAHTEMQNSPECGCFLRGSWVGLEGAGKFCGSARPRLLDSLTVPADSKREKEFLEAADLKQTNKQCGTERRNARNAAGPPPPPHPGRGPGRQPRRPAEGWRPPHPGSLSPSAPHQNKDND